MGKKSSVFTSRRLEYGMSGLSKNALMDLVVDRARAQIGAESSDEQLAAQIEEWLGPVFRARGDRPVSIQGRMRKLDENDEHYRNKTGPYRQVHPSVEKLGDAARLGSDYRPPVITPGDPQNNKDIGNV